MRREKMSLEKERAQKEADIRIRNGEVAALQKELDAINATVSQLQMQKGEAQKRLDELDDKVSDFISWSSFQCNENAVFCSAEVQA